MLYWRSLTRRLNNKGMSKLTEQQKKFAEGKAQGMTGPEAVAHAGYLSKGKAARNQASRMMANDGVASLVNELREESRSKAVKSAQEVKEGLSRLLDRAERENDFTGFVSLAGRLAKMEGHDEPERQSLEFVVNIGGDGEETNS